MKKALITGITGQDGSYLAALLLAKGYAVIGITSGKSDRHNLGRIADRIEWVTGDVTDEAFVREIVGKCAPDEIYNLASVATVAEPWKDVPGLARIVALTPLYFLEAIRAINSKTRFFQASSSEMFGAPIASPQDEQTPLMPRNPYGIGKAFAHSMVKGYRQNHGLYAASGILYTHESPRRPEAFVTRKITSSLAKIKLGLLDHFELGNLDARRDWGFAGDYVDAMWRTLEQDSPDDYVIATGKMHTVREVVLEACKALDIRVSFEGSGIDEIGKDQKGRIILKVNPTFYRPADTIPICGNSSHALSQLRWKPETSFEALVAMIAQADLELVQKQAKEA